MNGCVLLIVAALLTGVAFDDRAVATPITVYPAFADGLSQSLDGNWSFKYVAGLDPGADQSFFTPNFNASAWKSIHVPANWELQGFAEPSYANDLKDGLGLYRRSFRVPAAWRGGRRVCLRFEGVQNGFQVWVNGTKVGASVGSAYNPHTFDVTDALNGDPNADNVLAVQVTTKPHTWECDINDDWALSGICRDVTLFSVPTDHVQDLTVRTKLTAQREADVLMSVALSQPHGSVRGKLISPDGKTVSEFDLPQQADGTRTAGVHVAQPQLWTAETPSLYRLQLSLTAEGGEPLQKIEERIGLREVSIVDGVLELNGSPIKLHGVDHHDLDPLDGRAITDPEMRRDLDLMKKGNINFIRTSHYPPQPRFIKLCDEMGIYVMCEVPFGRGKVHFNDPSYHDDMMARVEPTITRDKNRPSVIVWSIGNESPVNDFEQEVGRRVKALDPTRPICYPKVASEYKKAFAMNPNYADIGTPHYPGQKFLRECLKNSKQPIILTEYAHAWGLATDNIQGEWDLLQASPRGAGGAIWHFMDQGLLRTSVKPFEAKEADSLVWVDDHHYYDTHGGDGCDGLVYSDRTPQVDFWEARKVYAPVQIAERSIAVKTGEQELAVHVENRFDFRTLSGIKMTWLLQRNGKELQRGDTALQASPHQKEAIKIVVTIPSDNPDDVLVLDLHVVDEKGFEIIDRTIRLDLPAVNRGAWTNALNANGNPTFVDAEKEIKIERADWVLTISRASGQLNLIDRQGQRLITGIYPHTGHKLTMTESLQAKKYSTWREQVLKELSEPKIQVAQEGTAVRVSVSGRYLRPEDPNQSFVGGYQIEIAPSGVLTVTYDFVPSGAKGELTEAGLTVALPAELTEFRWIGQGIFAGYPGKDRLNEFGLFHLNREDLRFAGNRREIELALMTTGAGQGVAMTPSSRADISVERADDAIYLSHNVALSSPGNKAWPPETVVNAGKIGHIAGQFTLLPLNPDWPPALLRWFGTPVPASNIFKPFVRSYDQ